MLAGTIFQTVIVVLGALLAAGCALLYFQRVHLERPAIGVFNARDIVIIIFFVLTLPFLYILLPSVVLIIILSLTFIIALSIGLSPLLRRRYVWTLIPLLLIADIVVAESLLGYRWGWQVYWLITDAVVLFAVVSISNLYVQGGMRLRHVAWFALLLAAYDGFFAFVVPISQQLADRFEGQPLDPSIGFAMGPYNANIGLGDLLVYCLFIVAAYKGFGKRGAITSFVVIGLFGALVPSMSQLVIAAVTRSVGVTIPAQVVFGPVALITFFWLSRNHSEHSMAEWFSAQAAAGRETVRASRSTRASRELALPTLNNMAASDVLPGTE